LIYINATELPRTHVANWRLRTATFAWLQYGNASAVSGRGRAGNSTEAR